MNKFITSSFSIIRIANVSNHKTAQSTSKISIYRSSVLKSKQKPKNISTFHKYSWSFKHSTIDHSILSIVLPNGYSEPKHSLSTKDSRVVAVIPSGCMKSNIQRVESFWSLSVFATRQSSSSDSSFIIFWSVDKVLHFSLRYLIFVIVNLGWFFKWSSSFICSNRLGILTLSLIFHLCSFTMKLVYFFI